MSMQTDWGSSGASNSNMVLMSTPFIFTNSVLHLLYRYSTDWA